MTTLKDNRPVMAEVLVRQVLGESEIFERICAQRGVSLVDAVGQALKSWMSGSLTLVNNRDRQSEPPPLLLPDPSECPQGQEREWLQICDHDMAVLVAEQARCTQRGDTVGLNRTNHSIEAYIQAIADLKERVA